MFRYDFLLALEASLFLRRNQIKDSHLGAFFQILRLIITWGNKILVHILYFPMHNIFWGYGDLVNLILDSNFQGISEAFCETSEGSN